MRICYTIRITETAIILNYKQNIKACSNAGKGLSVFSLPLATPELLLGMLLIPNAVGCVLVPPEGGDRIQLQKRCVFNKNRTSETHTYV
jgi:hypothetical protein